MIFTERDISLVDPDKFDHENLDIIKVLQSDSQQVRKFLTWVRSAIEDSCFEGVLDSRTAIDTRFKEYAKLLPAESKLTPQQATEYFQDIEDSNQLLNSAHFLHAGIDGKKIGEAFSALQAFQVAQKEGLLYPYQHYIVDRIIDDFPDLYEKYLPVWEFISSTLRGVFPAEKVIAAVTSQMLQDLIKELNPYASRNVKLQAVFSISTEIIGVVKKLHETGYFSYEPQLRAVINQASTYSVEAVVRLSGAIKSNGKTPSERANLVTNAVRDQFRGQKEAVLQYLQSPPAQS